MVSGGLDGGFWAIYTPQGPRTPEGYRSARSAALQTAVRIREMVARNHEHFELALHADDAAAIEDARQTRGLSQRRKFVSARPRPRRAARLLRARRAHARTGHFMNNDLADSSTDPKGKEWNG